MSRRISPQHAAALACLLVAPLLMGGACERYERKMNRREQLKRYLDSNRAKSNQQTEPQAPPAGDSSQAR